MPGSKSAARRYAYGYSGGGKLLAAGFSRSRLRETGAGWVLILSTRCAYCAASALIPEVVKGGRRARRMKDQRAFAGRAGSARSRSKKRGFEALIALLVVGGATTGKEAQLETAVNRVEPATGGSKAPEEYVGYEVRDPEGRRMGCVKELFANARGEPEYVRVKMGLLGLKSVLIPIGLVGVREGPRTLTLR